MQTILPLHLLRRSCLATLIILGFALHLNAALPTDPAPITASFDSLIIDDGKDLIFPSIIEAPKHFDNPLAKYYLYTSPHAGADIRLYLSDKIKGPWRFHGTVVDDKTAWAPHVSSPHAVWNEEAQALFLYVHAPNAQTVYLHSKDGINFEFGKVCVTRYNISNTIEFDSKSASYARVHRYRIPEYNNTWTMTLTASGTTNDDGTQNSGIILCTSDDGADWTVRRLLIDDGGNGKEYKTLDGCWIPMNGRNYLVYALRSRAEEGENAPRIEPTRLHISIGDENWRNWKHLGVFYTPFREHPDDNAARGVSTIPDIDPSIILYEGGQHGHARIGLLNLEGAKVDR